MSSIREELDFLARSNVGAVPRLSLRPAEAAEALGISRSELDKLTREGRIPSVRLADRLVVFPVAALVSWLSAQAREAIRASEKADNSEEVKEEGHVV